MKLTNRLSWTGWCGVVGIAIFAVLVALPATHWVVNRHLMYVRGDIVHFDIDVLYPSIEEALPQTVRSSEKSVRLDTLRALILQDPSKRLRALDALSDNYPQDAFVQSELGRYACMDSRPLYEKRWTPTPDDLYRSRLLLNAAQRGQKIEPTNAFFTIINAIGYYLRGDINKAQAELVTASILPDYREGLRQETDLLLNWYRTEAYVGNAFAPDALRFYAGPQTRQLERIMRQLRSKGTPREQVASRLLMLRIAEMVGRKADYANGMGVAFRLAKDSIEPNEKPLRDGLSSNDRYLKQARALQDQAQSMGIPSIDVVGSIREHIARTDAIQERIRKAWNSDTPDTHLWMQWSCSTIATVLFSLLVIGLMIIGQRRWKHEGLSLASPLLLPLAFLVMAFYEQSKFNEGSPLDFWLVIQTVLVVLAIIAAFPSRLRQWVPWLSGGAIVAGLLQGGFELLDEQGWLPWDYLAPSMSPAWIISVTIGITWLLCLPSRPKWLLWTSAILIVLAISAFLGGSLVNLASMDSLDWSSFIPLIVLLVLVPTFGPRPQVRLNRLMGPLLLVGMLVYLGFVSYERSCDKIMGTWLNADLSQADSVRSLTEYSPRDHEDQKRPNEAN